MDNYRLQILSNDAFACISFSLSAVALDHYYDHIQTSLRSECKGRVLFDQLLSHGINSNRFVSMYFDGEKFDIETLKIENNINHELKGLCKTFYSDMPETLSNGVLTKSQQFLIKKGRIF